ncbi:hypothetical protein ACHQM5_027863 [Ranunculus cassubicifolius]
MVTATQEDGVLKLVYPGGHVEIHTKPLTAAQVMKKNPRHCVARTDVFKFPWIVVRPDSVLKLGDIFLIVPNHTIHRLLRACGTRHHPTLCRRGLKQQSRVEDEQAREQAGADYWLEVTPEIQQASYKSWADPTPKHRDRTRTKEKDQAGSCAETIAKHEVTKCSADMVGKKRAPNVTSKQQISCFGATHVLEDRPEGPSQIKRCTKENPKQVSRDQCLRKYSPVSSKEQQQNSSLRYSSSKPPDSKTGHAGLVLLPQQDMLLPKLKSCLRKTGDEVHPRSKGVKVTFKLPRQKM